MRLGNRIRKIERIMEERRLTQRELQCVIQRAGETEEAAIESSGIGPDDDFVVVKKFSDGTVYEPKHTQTKPAHIADIDAEIARLKAQLLKDGLTGQDIAEVAEEPK